MIWPFINALLLMLGLMISMILIVTILTISYGIYLSLKGGKGDV